MSANRCPTCSTNWPNENKYDPCPECLVETNFFMTARPIDIDEAQSRWNHARFRDYERENPGDWRKLPLKDIKDVERFEGLVEEHRARDQTLRELAELEPVEPTRPRTA